MRTDHYGYPVSRGQRGWSSADVDGPPQRNYGRQDAGLQEATGTVGDMDNRTEPAGGLISSDDMKWISVDKRLPDDGMTVLVAAPGASEPVWLGYYEDRWYWENHEHVRQNVTHWMPLPELPK